MRKSVIFGLSALAFLAAGCQKDSVKDDVRNPHGRTFTAVMEQPLGNRASADVRASVDNDGIFSWREDDPVTVINSDGTTESSKIKLGDRTTFETTLANPAHAIYPDYAGVFSDGTLKVSLPAVYDYSSTTPLGTPLLATLNEGNVATFKHLGGAAKVSFTNVPAGINKFVFTTDRRITGTFDITENDGKKYIATEKSSSNNVVTYNFEASSGSALTFYIPLPVGTYKYMKAELYAGETLKACQETSQDNEMIARRLGILPQLNYNDIDIVIEDLSSSGTANCYIVSQPGYYKFKATHKGNSTTETVGSVDKAEVLWETFGTADEINEGDLVSDAKYIDGYISFRCKTSQSNRGNAVIAAKDASGTILWSWHIWMTDKPANQVYRNSAGTMMDRNLGATSADKGTVGALGLLYQWGRKDPFLGGSAKTGTTKAKSTSNDWSVVSSTSNIGNATKHPTTLFNSSVRNWHNPVNTGLWSKTKTVNDPCPPGYRVPDGDGNGVWSKILDIYYINNSTGMFDSTNKGFNFGNGASYKFTDNSATCWYPCAGYVEASLGLVGDNGYYWSCSTYDSKAYSLYLASDGDIFAVNQDASERSGLSVRCLKQ